MHAGPAKNFQTVKSVARRGGAPREIKGANDRKPREERWEELLSAAADIFYEKGYDATSLQDIADRVGILKGSIYYYIKSKADLRDHLLVDVHHSGIDMMRRCASVEGSALEKLESMIRGHVDYICRNLAKTAVYLQELKKLTPDERAAMLGPNTYRNVILDVLRLGRDEGLLLPELDLKLTAQVMLGSLNSIYQWYQPSVARPCAAIADHLVGVLLRGHATEQGLRALSRKAATSVAGDRKRATRA